MACFTYVLQGISVLEPFRHDNFEVQELELVAVGLLNAWRRNVGGINSFRVCMEVYYSERVMSRKSFAYKRQYESSPHSAITIRQLLYENIRMTLSCLLFVYCV